MRSTRIIFALGPVVDVIALGGEKEDGGNGVRKISHESFVVHDQLVAVQHAVTSVVLRNSSTIARSEPPAR